jgi:PASTA domain
MGSSHRRLSVLGASIGVLLFAAAALGSSGAASSPGGPSTATPSATATGTARTGSTRPTAPAVVLYDQYNNQAIVTPTDITSQDFEPASDNYDSFAADDFVVPVGQTWNIQGIDVDGEYNGGPAASFNVRFYANGASLPGALVTERLAQSFTGVDGDATIALAAAVPLAAGTYWVSVQARQDFDPAGQWYWHNRTVLSNATAAWQNPGNGFGSGCLTWNRKASCIATQAYPDQVYRLNGTTPQPPPPPVRCRVPRVVGLTLARAKTRIRRANCRVGRVRRVRRGRPGRVLSQSPRAGTIKPRGFAVRLVVGRA